MRRRSSGDGPPGERTINLTTERASVRQLPLLSCLKALMVDPALLASFERDPDAILREANLTDAEKNAIKSRDIDQVQHAVMVALARFLLADDE